MSDFFAGDAERHPSWVLIRANRGSISPPGAVLFQSDIRHRSTITITVQRAERRRRLHTDWLFGYNRRNLIQIEMSEAQWGAFVSSFGDGTGVPATLRYHDGVEIEEPPFQPRLAESLAEVNRHTTEAWAEVMEHATAVEEAIADKKGVVSAVRTLINKIRQQPSNANFAAKSLTEHAENVVSKASADIEAMMLRHAMQLGIDPADRPTLELEAGDQ